MRSGGFNVTEWAQEKKAKIAAAKKLREERKLILLSERKLGAAPEEQKPPTSAPKKLPRSSSLSGENRTTPRRKPKLSSENKTKPRKTSLASENKRPRPAPAHKPPLRNSRQALRPNPMANLPLGSGGPCNIPEYAEYPNEARACPHCGRTFNPEPLAKHVKICKKVFKQQRKEFNSAKQRADEVIPMEIRRAKPQKPTRKQIASTKNHWQEKSEQFRAVMRAARLADKGGVAYERAAAKASEYKGPDLVPCKFCKRTFNEIAHARHVPFCEKKFKEAKIKQGGPAGRRRR